MEKSAFSVCTNQHSLPSTTHFLPPTFLNLFSTDTAHSWRTAQSTVETFYFLKFYKKNLGQDFLYFGMLFHSYPWLPSTDVRDTFCAHSLTSPVQNSKCKEDICASLSHAKNSAKKKTELTSCERNILQSLKSFLERAGRLTSHFFSFFSWVFFKWRIKKESFFYNMIFTCS